MNRWDKLPIRLNIEGIADKIQVPRGKGEKNFDKRVKRT